MAQKATVHRGKGLSRDVIARAAVELVERDGLDALTMRHIARDLGVEAMSLYTYFATKHEITLAMADHILRSVAATTFDSGDARQDAIDLASALRKALRSHPNTARLFALQMDLQDSDAIEQLSIQSLSVLMRLGLDTSAAVYAYGTLLAFVTGHVLLEVAQLRAGAPPRSVYDPATAFVHGVEALLDAASSGWRTQRGRKRPVTA